MDNFKMSFKRRHKRCKLLYLKICVKVSSKTNNEMKIPDSVGECDCVCCQGERIIRILNVFHIFFILFIQIDLEIGK